MSTAADFLPTSTKKHAPTPHACNTSILYVGAEHSLHVTYARTTFVPHGTRHTTNTHLFPRVSAGKCGQTPGTRAPATTRGEPLWSPSGGPCLPTTSPSSCGRGRLRETRVRRDYKYRQAWSTRKDYDSRKAPLAARAGPSGICSRRGELIPIHSASEEMCLPLTVHRRDFSLG